MKADPQQPPTTASQEVARGWPIVATAAYGIAVGTSGFLAYPLPMFVQPLNAEFNWSRQEIYLAVSYGTFVMAISGPIAGRLCDWFGARRVAPIAAFLVAGCIALLSQMKGDIKVFYALYSLMALVGGGTSFSCYTRAVAANFDRARGMALGFSLLGTGFAATFSPILLPPIIEAHGWRAGYVALAVASALAILPAAVFLREPSRAAREKAPAEAKGFTLLDAMRTRQFWSMFVAGVLTTMIVTGTQLNLLPMLEDMGVAKTSAQNTLALYGVAMIVARIAVGVLVDRFPATRVAAVVYLLPAVGLAGLGTGHVELALFAAVTVGSVAAAQGSLMGYLSSRHFGLKAFAEIFGWLVGGFALGGMIGAAAAGAIYEITGDYRIWLLGSAALCVGMAALLGTLGRYRF